MNNTTIFIAAHKDFKSEIFPKNDVYTILINDPNYKIHKNDNLSNIKNNKIIDISDDEFCYKYRKLLSEYCHLHYLYEHQDLLGEYVGFYQYGKYFNEFINNESKIEDIFVSQEKSFIGFNNANNVPPYYKNIRKFINEISLQHILYIVKLIDIDFYEFLNNACHNEISGLKCYPRNMFIMKKHDFIEFMKFDNALVNKLLELYNIDDTNIKDFINANKFGITDFKCYAPDRWLAFIVEYINMIYLCYKFGRKSYDTTINIIYDDLQSNKIIFDNKPSITLPVDNIYVLNISSAINNKLYFKKMIADCKITNEFKFTEYVGLPFLNNQPKFVDMIKTNYFGDTNNAEPVKYFSSLINHYAIIKYNYDNNKDHLLVFEDDTNINDPELFNYYLNNLPEDYDIVRFGVCPWYNFNDDKHLYNKKDGEFIVGIQCYLMSRKGMKAFLDLINTYVSYADFLFCDLYKTCNVYYCKDTLIS